MKEAIDLAGIFIDQGAMAIVSDNTMLIQTLKDLNRGTIYDGPMIVLVNGSSASASEIFAAIMQDYNRALIVGSTTFGKASGQIIYPLDPSVNPFSTAPQKTVQGKGFIKLTTGKFYRTTGQSYQTVGVIPDIKLEMPLEKLEFKENMYSNALSSGKITKKTYYYPLKPLPLDSLLEKSKHRLQSDTAFTKLSQLNSALYYEIDGTEVEIPLEWSSFTSYISNVQDKIQKIKKIIKSGKNSFLVSNTHFEKDKIQINSSFAAYNSEQIEQISGDLYIHESYFIILDLIKLLTP